MIVFVLFIIISIFIIIYIIAFVIIAGPEAAAEGGSRAPQRSALQHQR